MLESWFKLAGFPVSRVMVGVLLLLIVGIALQACGGDEPLEFVSKPCPVDGAGGGGEVHQDANRLACDNSNFAFDLYRALGEEAERGENLFFSPYSISQVLAMAYAGARGETERQMAETLRYSLPQEKLHPAFAGLDEVLGSRSEDSYTSPDPDGESTAFRLNISNAVWGQDGYEFYEDYLDVLKDNYGGGLRRVDFASETEESRSTINEWVAEQTEDKIKNLMPQGSIDPLTRLVLTNAIYFNGGWFSPFFEEATEDQPFYLVDNEKVEVPMMTGRHREGAYRHASGSAFQAVEIPYATYGMSMIAFLPDKGRLEELENSLTAGNLDQIEWERKDVTLNMPSFEFSSEFSLVETLTSMGMTDAFNAGIADFSGMTDEEALYVSAVIHKAFVSVDEEGTAAAAATGAVGYPEDASTPPPLEPITVTFDRPFMFLIREQETGVILFLGRVMDPRPPVDS